MRVLVIPTWYPNGEDKLMGVYHKEFTYALNNYGIKADMLFIDRQRLSNPFKYLFMKKKEIDKETNYNVYIYKLLNLSPISFKLGINRYVKKLDYAFKDYLKHNEKPDLIHAHVTVPAGYAACIIGKKYNIPVIVTEHCGNLERFYKNDSLKKYGNFVLKNSTYSTVSKYMKDIVLKYTNECYIIPNLVDTTPFNNDVVRKRNNVFKLVSVCALREGKRLDIAFKAIKKLKEQNIKIHLDVIGDGFYENYYKQVCDELNLHKEITFLGRKNKFEIAEILKKENALLISSELESFGIPGIEAMASGLPIVSTDCLGPTEYINSKVGVICKINDVDDMADKIKYLINHYEKYDSSYIRKEASKYSKEEVIKNTIKLYNKVLKNND
mgnify:FL=1